MTDEKPLVLLVNSTPKERGVVEAVLAEIFQVSCVRSISLIIPRLKKLAKEDYFYGAVCCLDADGITEKRKALFSAKYLWKMGVPVVCYSVKEYDERQWKFIESRFPELNIIVPYLLYQEGQGSSSILSALIAQKVEKGLRKEKRLWSKFKARVAEAF